MTTEPGKAAPSRTVKVWDGVSRLLHWSLAGAFALAYATGEEAFTVHEIAGIAVVAIVGLRFLWGALGPERARLSAFVPGPVELGRYLGALARGRPPRHVGHNPAGGLWAVLLLLLSGGAGVTGWLSIAAGGPLGRAMHEAHEVVAGLALAAVLVHVAAAVAMSLVHRENLIRAMIDGRKRP